MEIFSGARLESSERAAYLAMVSALEPLADARLLGEEVDHFIEDCIQRLRDTDKIDPNFKPSLRGRLNDLRSESIRGALKRLTQERLCDHPAAWSIIDEAYALRSEIVHSGRPRDLDIDIQDKARQLEQVVLALYQSYMTPNS